MLVEFARTELQLAGLLDKGSDYDGMLGKAVLELMQVFARQGHSGGSAGKVVMLFSLLAGFQPLSPLTGGDEEWIEVAEQDGKPLLQNKRCSTVFRCGEDTYDIAGRGFRYPDGRIVSRGMQSRVPVTFPYKASVEYVDVPEEEEDAQ